MKLEAPRIPWKKLYKVPLVGSWRGKFLRIDNMFSQQCTVNPFFAVVGAFSFAPILLASVVEFDCIDIAFDRVGRPHRRKRRASGNIAELLPSLPVPNGFVGTAMFAGAKLAQKIGYWMLVADAFQESIVVGTSFAFKMSGCNDPFAPSGYLTADHAVPMLPGPGVGYMVWQVNSCVGGASCGPTAILIPGGFNGGAGMSLTQVMNQYPGLPDATWTAQVVETQSGQRTGQLSPQQLETGEWSLYWATPSLGFRNSLKEFRVILTKSAGALVLSGFFQATGETPQKLQSGPCLQREIR